MQRLPVLVAEWCVCSVRVFLEVLLLAGGVAGEAEGVVARRFEGHRGVASAVGVVAVGALQVAVVHHALHEGVALHAIFVRGAVLPKLGRGLALGREGFPKIFQGHRPACSPQARRIPSADRAGGRPDGRRGRHPSNGRG